MFTPLAWKRSVSAAACAALLAPGPSWAGMTIRTVPRGVSAPLAPLTGALRPLGFAGAAPLSPSLSPSLTPALAPSLAPALIPAAADAPSPLPSPILNGGPAFGLPPAAAAPAGAAPRVELTPAAGAAPEPAAASAANAMGSDLSGAGLRFDAALSLPSPLDAAVDASGALPYRTPLSDDGRVALVYGSRVVAEPGTAGASTRFILRVSLRDPETGGVTEESGTLWLGAGESVERVAPMASVSDPRKIYFAVRREAEGVIELRSLDMDTQRVSTVLAMDIPADEKDLRVIGLSDDGAAFTAYGKSTNTLYRRSADAGVERVPGPAGYKGSVHAMPDGAIVVNQGKSKLSVYPPGASAPRAVTLSVETASDGSQTTTVRAEGEEGAFVLSEGSRFRGAALQNKGKTMPLAMVLRGISADSARIADLRRAAAETAAAEQAALRERAAALEEAARAAQAAGTVPAAEGAAAVPAAAKDWAAGLPAKPLPGAGLVARAMSTLEGWRRYYRQLTGARIAKPSELKEYEDLISARKLILSQVEETVSEGTNRSGKGSLGRIFRLLLGAALKGAVALAFVAADVVIFSGFWSGILGGPFGVPASMMPLLIGSSLWGLVAVGIVHAAKGKNRSLKAVAVATLAALFVVGVMVGLSHLGVDPTAVGAAVGVDPTGGFLGDAAAPVTGAAAAAPAVGGLFGPVASFLTQFPVLGPAVFGVFAVASSLSAGSWLFSAAGMFSRAFGDKRLDADAWDRLDQLQRVRMGQILRRMGRLERAIPDIETQLRARDEAAAERERTAAAGAAPVVEAGKGE